MKALNPEHMGFITPEVVGSKGIWYLSMNNNENTLVFQIPCEDRYLDPQTPPEVRPLGGPNTDPHKVFGGFWKTKDSTSFMLVGSICYEAIRIEANGNVKLVTDPQMLWG